MANSDPVRKHLRSLLQMKGAHADFDSTVDGFPVKLRGQKIAGAPHTAWELLEHLRITQEDILDFSRNPEYREKKWPDDYWPATEAPPTKTAWEESVARFRKDLRAMMALVAASDLMERIPHGTGQTLLREALLAADHNAYHLGQLMFVRRTLEGRES